MNRFEDEDSKSMNDDDQNDSSIDDQPVTENDSSQKQNKLHRHTVLQSKIIEDDLMKVKSKLQEDIVNQIYKSCDPSA